MLIKGVDFPEELRRAQAAGELVIFAGAGVSVPSPSDLPLFNALAKSVGEGSGIIFEEHEPPDRYLGRLKKKGINVHEASAGKLTKEDSKPHELHSSLIKIFPSADRVRIVTTNFDNHFSTAASGVFDEAIETFIAPALPLGDDFSGLVYLHGSAVKNPQRCVLTDEDFGRAYLTQAWASRFLATMFSRYVVLFVGYSHEDIVMSYLARGLPPVGKKERFALTLEGADSLSKWEFLGIRPLLYKKVSGVNEHQALTDAIVEWANESQRGLLEKAPRIRIISENQPPLEGEDNDYIKFCLSDIDTARLFFKYAKSPEWISWLEKHKFIHPIFNASAELDVIHQEMTVWLVKTFLTENTQPLMAALERHDNKMGPLLCQCISRRLSSRGNNPLPNEVFSQWVAILLAQPFHYLPLFNWGMLLSECGINDRAASILLFDHITNPRTVLKKEWRFLDAEHFDEDGIALDIHLQHRGDDANHWLKESWTNLFSPNLGAYALELEPIVIKNLIASHRLLSLSDAATSDRDPFRSRRQSIRPHSQNHLPSSVDVLIDAVREILDYWIATNPNGATNRIEQWFDSKIPILQRIAIYGFSNRVDISPNEKLKWILDKNLLYEFKTDIFHLLEASYAKASPEAQGKILEGAATGPKFDESNDETNAIKKYEIFNLVVWLHRAAPDSQITKAQFEKLKSENPNFGERDYPDLNSWSGGGRFVDDAEGINLENRSPEEFLDEMLDWKPRHPLDRSRRGYCSAISTIISKNPEWGIAWIRTLLSRGLTDADLWQCICQGWRNAELSENQWSLIFDFVETIEAPEEFFSAFVEVLDHGSRREKNALPESLIEQAHRIAVRIWNGTLINTPAEPDPSKDWLSVAINHPGGRLAEFWLQRISYARKTAGDAWLGLSAEIADQTALMLRSTCGAAAHVRIVLASQLHYFFSLDPKFARAELLPLFDWHTDELRAEQCWHGFLFWGRWLPGFTEQLRPFFDETINRNATLEKDVHENLVNHIAGVALFNIDDPLKENWMQTVLQRLSDDDRIKFAAVVNHYLEDIEASIAEKIWSRWLMAYWNMRLLNIPKPLLANEANEMTCWAMNMGIHFSEAMALAQKMKAVLTFEHTPIIYSIDTKHKELLSLYPSAVADLILLYLDAPLNFFHVDDHVKNIWQALQTSSIPADKLRQLREALFRRGYNPDEQ